MLRLRVGDKEERRRGGEEEGRRRRGGGERNERDGGGDGEEEDGDGQRKMEMERGGEKPTERRMPTDRKTGAEGSTRHEFKLEFILGIRIFHHARREGCRRWVERQAQGERKTDTGGGGAGRTCCG